MSAPLETFLRAITSGNTTFSPEMYAHFGGDDILAQLRKYDPNATWTDIAEGGEGQAAGKRLDFDVAKLPKSKRGTAGYDLNPANLHSRSLPGSTPHADDVYGDVRNSMEFMKEKDPLWTKIAPLVVGMGGPAMGAALAGMGIGGAAGLTAGATGSGLTGMNSLNIPSWLSQAMGKAPQYAGQVSQGKFDPLGMLLQMGGSYAGVSPALLKGGMTLANLARSR